MAKDLLCDEGGMKHTNDTSDKALIRRTKRHTGTYFYETGDTATARALFKEAEMMRPVPDPGYLLRRVARENFVLDQVVVERKRGCKILEEEAVCRVKDWSSLFEQPLPETA